MNKFLLRRLGVADDPGGYKPTLHDCLEAVLSQSDALVDDMLAGLQALLAPVKGKGLSLHAVSSAGKVAIAALVPQSEVFKQVFAKSLRAALYGGDAQRSRAKPLMRFDDFQFLEEDQIDANIEFALTQQEVLLAVEDVLPTLNGMVSSLMGWSTVQAHLSPLKPESFVFALRESLAAVVSDDEARAALMMHAASLMGSSLRQLYKEVSDWLRSQGIESVAVSNVSVGSFGAPVKTPENTVTRTMLTLDKLRRLLSGELDPGPQAGGTKDFTHTVPASYVALEDMKLVEPMMKRLAQRASLDNEASPGKINKPVDMLAGGRTAKPDPQHSKKLGRQLGEEVVRLMLENLMQDRRLLAPVRKNLQAMEPVLLRLSQSDPRFFSERQHPARQFLDKITSRSLAFSSPEEPGCARFQKTLENSVNVLVSGEGDAASFARVLRKLEEGWSRDEHEQRQRAEEAARGLLHAEQRNLLAQRMSQDFTERLQNKRVPDMVASFLRGPWAQVVAESQLLCADGASDPDGYLALVDDLIWSVQLKLARRNRSRLVAMVPGMLVTMRQGLGLINYPPERITTFFDELITLHEKAFEGARPVAVEGDATVAEGETVAPATVEPEGFWVGDQEALDSGFLPEPTDIELDFTAPAEVPETEELQDWTTDSLITGSWVDLALGGVWVRAQLTWASPHRTLFMFISGAGLAHSMSRRTMDRLHRMGLIRLVSDGRVMDNALDGVAQTALRNDVQKAGGAA
jgi:hypothetical protein